MEGFGWFGEFVGGESRVGRGEMGCGGKGGILGQIYVPIGHFLLASQKIRSLSYCLLFCLH